MRNDAARGFDVDDGFRPFGGAFNGFILTPTVVKPCRIARLKAADHIQGGASAFCNSFWLIHITVIMHSNCGL